MPVKESRELKAKRAKLVKLLTERYNEQLAAMRDNPSLDYNLGRILERSDPAVIKRDVSRLSESHIDELLEWHAPTTHRFVW